MKKSPADGHKRGQFASVVRRCSFGETFAPRQVAIARNRSNRLLQVSSNSDSSERDFTPQVAKRRDNALACDAACGCC